MSPELQRFYNELQEWLDDEGGEGSFNRHCAICDNLGEWLAEQGFRMDVQRRVADEFIEQLQLAGLELRYPFNNGQYGQFDHEASEGDLWRNERRLRWVKDHSAQSSSSSSDKRQ